MPPSVASIDAGIPSGTSSAGTFLNPRPDITQLVWLADAGPLSWYDDAALRPFVTAEMLIQLAGLDVVATTDVGGASYVRWSHATWKATGVDDLAGAQARGAILRQAIALRHLGPPPARKPAVAGLVQDPVTLVATALGDGVQLLRSLSLPGGLLGPGPWPPGVPSTLPAGLAYLRYNVGDDQTKLALASAVQAAAYTHGARWADLRARIASGSRLLGALTTAVTANGTPQTPTEKAAAAARVWTPLQPWCLVPGNLDALAGFVEEATGAEWSGWVAPRANVARFRILLDFYTRLTTPG
jgi:hypothetical protein